MSKPKNLDDNKAEKEEYKDVENKVENKPEQKTDEKVMNILQKAKIKGNITYGELATELGDVNPEQIDKVFDAFEEFGVDVLKDDLEEPDINDLEEMEEII